MEVSCEAGSDARGIWEDSPLLFFSTDVILSCQSPQDADHFNIAPLDFAIEEEIIAEIHNSERKLTRTSKKAKDGKSRKTAQCLAQQMEDGSGMEKKYEEIFKYLTEGEIPSGFDYSQRYYFKQGTAKFTLKEGELFVGKRRVIKSEEEARRIFGEFHASPMGGHSGINRTRSAISSRFFWHRMSIDIDNWIRECVKCQKVRKPLSAPQPLQSIKDTNDFNIAPLDFGIEEESSAEKHNSKSEPSRTSSNGMDEKSMETAQCFSQQIQKEAAEVQSSTGDLMLATELTEKTSTASYQEQGDMSQTILHDHGEYCMPNEPELLKQMVRELKKTTYQQKRLLFSLQESMDKQENEYQEHQDKWENERRMLQTEIGQQISNLESEVRKKDVVEKKNKDLQELWAKSSLKVHSLDQKISHLKSKVSDLRCEKEVLEKNNKDLQALWAKNSLNVESLGQQISDLKSEVRNLRCEKKLLEKKNKDLQEQLAKSSVTVLYLDQHIKEEATQEEETGFCITSIKSESE